MSVPSHNPTPTQVIGEAEVARAKVFGLIAAARDLEEKGGAWNSSALGHVQDALRLAESVIPDLGAAYGSLPQESAGTLISLLQELGRGHEALDWLRHESSTNSGRHYNLGHAHWSNADYEKALREFRVAAADPVVISGKPDIHEHLARLCLTTSRFDEGWKTWADHWCRKEHRPDIHPLSGESLSNGDIVVAFNEGVGDQVMYARCVEPLLRSASTCCLVCDPRLVRVFQNSFQCARVVPCSTVDLDAEEKSGRIVIPSRVLPAITRPEVGGAPEQILATNTARVNSWQAHLRDRFPGKRVIGFAWRGGFCSGQAGRLRSFWSPSDIAQLAPLGTLRDVVWIDLQNYGEHHVGDVPIEMKRIDGLDLRGDVDDILSGIAAMHGVVSVDNANVHFAGAIGTPVIAMLPFCSDWRWKASGSSSYWYQRVELERQSAPGRWAEVVARVAARLQNGWPSNCV